MPREKAPAYQRYAKQILGDDICLAMDWDAYGMHNWLLDISWQQTPPGTIPDDQAVIRRWLRNPSDDVWRRVWPQIMPAWPSIADGRRGNNGMIRAAKRSETYRANRLSKQNANKTTTNHEQSYEDEEEVIPEVGFSVEDFDGEFAFREFCSLYPKSDESAIAQNEFLRAVESIVKGQKLANRAEACKWLLARTAVYLKLVPTKFQASMVNYLNRRIFNQKDAAWRQDGSKTDERQRQGFDAIGAALAKRTGGFDGRHAEEISRPAAIEGAGRRLPGRLDDAGK